MNWVGRSGRLGSGMNLWLRFRYGTCRRLRDILAEAPWSNYDLLISLIVFGVGLYMLVCRTMFQHIGGVYAKMAQVADELTWGLLFVACGGISFAITIWCYAPGFLWRLGARMATAFCLLVLAGNNALHMPPPLSTVTYILLAIWAVWGILRTRSSGR